MRKQKEKDEGKEKTMKFCLTKECFPKKLAKSYQGMKI
jgi:hypothetical protein